MKDLKNHIETIVQHIEKTLRQPNADHLNLITQKEALLDMLFLIALYEKYHLTRKDIDEIISLQTTATNSSEYPIVDDNDVDNRTYWRELLIEEQPLRLQAKDIVIKRK